MKAKLPTKKNIFVLTISLLSLIVLVGLINLYCETAGVPDFLRRRIEERLQDKGLYVSFNSLRIGLINGFKAENVVIWDGETRASRFGEVKKVHITGDILSVMRGEPGAVDFSIEKAEIYFPASSSELGGEAEFIASSSDDDSAQLSLVQNVNLQAEHSRAELKIHNFSGETAVGRLEGQGEVVKIGEWVRSIPDQERELSWRLLIDEMSEDEHRYFQRFRQMAADRLIEDQDLQVTTDFYIDPENPAENRVDGVIKAKNQWLDNLPLHLFKGRYTLTPDMFKITDFTCNIGSDSVITGEARYLFQESEINGRLQGRVNPDLPFRLSDRRIPTVFTESRFLDAPEFSLNFSSPTLKLKDMQADGTVSAENVYFRRQLLSEVSFKFNKQAENLDIRGLNMEFGQGRGDERLRGDLQITLNGAEQEPLVSGDLDGQILPETVRRLLPDSVDFPDETISELRFAKTPPSFHVRLQDSGLASNTWRGELSLGMKDFSYRNREMQKLECAFDFDGGTIRTTAPLEVVPEKAGEYEQRVILDSLKIEPADKIIEGEGRAFVDPAELCQIFDLSPDHDLRKLTLREAPLKIGFEVRSKGFDKTAWQLDFDINGKNINYDGADFKTFTAAGSVDLPQIQVDDMMLVKDEEQYISISGLEYDRRRNKMTLAAEAVADPALFEIFISDESSREQYRDIWEQVEWQSEAPSLKVSRLHYEEGHLGNWQLRMNAAIEGNDFRYKELDAEEISFDVNLDLPGSVKVDNIKGKYNNEFIQGEAQVGLTGTPFLQFSLAGEFDVFEFIKSIRPEQTGEVEYLDAEKDTKTSFTGTIGLKEPSSQHLECEVSGKLLEYKNLQFENYSASWRKVNHEVKWELPEAELGGGEIELSGYNNSFFNRGGLSLNAQDVDLAALVSQLNNTETAQNLGELSADAQLDLRTPPDDDTTFLTGDGNVKIRKGDLWQAPILARLGDLLGMGKLGRISKLDAPVKFSGNHLQVKEFKTDGTILALSGNGKYYWDRQNQLDFKVYGELLKSTRLIPFLLKPASWFFEAKLSGSLDDYKWSVMGPVKRIFSSDE
ncbi:MAG: AsmA-like C-terminal region-containing protein [Verrucomicrobiota bacterium]